MNETLSLAELSQRTGEPVERLREWRALRLIGRHDCAEFVAEDVQRARLVQLLLRRGISLEAIARANEEEDFISRYVDLMFPARAGPGYALSEAADVLGLAPDVLRRLWDAAGLGEQNEWLDEADLAAFRGLKTALEAGIPEEALLQIVRVWADALGRVAEAESRLFHFYVHGRLKAEGLSGRELVDTTRAVADQAVPLVEPAVLYFHRKGWERSLREDAVMHLQEAAGLAGAAWIPGQLRMAIVFIDLSSFTPLADVMGDEVAAQVLDRFSHLVRDSVARCEGRVVKQLGDGFLLAFAEPRSAVRCALDIERRTAPQFPAARGAVHWGDVLYREGDYVGTAVNVAARLASEAERHQVLVTAAVRREVGNVPEIGFAPLGKRQLRGLTEEVEVFQVVPAAAGTTAERVIDPVCGMELGAGEAAARLTIEGRERSFCSEACLQRFVAAPQRYGIEGEKRRSP